MLCRDCTLVKYHAHSVRLTPLKCRSWRCEYCQPLRRRELAAVARAGMPDTFLTLTLPPREGETFDARARALARAWRIIRARACKKWGYKSIPFLAVFEAHKSGMPHLHILARCKWIGFDELRAWNTELTGGSHVRIERPKSVRGVAKYVAKYVSEEPKLFAGCKRYWRSLNWRIVTPPRTADDADPCRATEIETFHLETVARAFMADGYARQDERGWTILTPPADASQRAPPWP